jgi:uncharacterized protein (DUF362 family)
MPDVILRDTSENLKADVSAIFEHFGGLDKLVKGRPILVKPNGVHFGPSQTTAIEFLDALFSVLRDFGQKQIFFMEACTAGNLTRIVFRAVGWDKLCKRYGVKPVYLDEGKTRPLLLPGEDTPVQFPAFLHERLIERREENFYLAVPRLKTHSMSHVTLAIKGQMGFLIPIDRMKDHNFNLAKRLVRILKAVRPDFTIIEGITANARGHIPVTGDLEKNLIQTKALVGGNDVVAVDSVGAKIFGYDPSEVEHLRLAGESGLGCADLSKIKIIGDLSRFKERYPYIPEFQIPKDIRRIYGKEMACIQGCRGNTEITIDMMCREHGGKGGWNFVCGKGIDKAELEYLTGDFLVVGPCAANEVGRYLKQKYPNQRVYIVREHNDIQTMSGKVVRLTGISLTDISPIPVPLAVWLFLKSWLKGMNAKVCNPY